jgi:tetratricopeptide (TPR) repeat protein
VIARAYVKNGKTEKAISEYERLMQYDPDMRLLIHPKYHYRLGKLYEEKGLIEKAIEEYETFIEIWKDAEKDRPELIDAKKRLARLTAEF